MLFRRLLLPLVAALVPIFPTSASEPTKQLKGVIFGDSYSDTRNGCNLDADPVIGPFLTGLGINPFYCPPRLLAGLPVEHFYPEAQLTNGKVWAAQLGEKGFFHPSFSDPAFSTFIGDEMPPVQAPRFLLDLPTEPSASIRFPFSGNFNFAVAASTTSVGVVQADAFLERQRQANQDQFPDDTPEPLKFDESFSVIFLGGNDIISALLRDETDTPLGRALTVTFAARNVLEIASKVRDQTKTIAVVKNPNTGLLPQFYANDLGPRVPGLFGDADEAKRMTLALNGLVKTGLQSRKFANNHIVWIDIDNLVETIRLFPGAQVKSKGTYLTIPTNFTTPCIEPESGCSLDPEAPNNPDTFAFWDQAHPTQAVHKLFANCIQATLNGYDKKSLYGYKVKFDYKTMTKVKTVGPCGVPPFYRWFLYR